ncbi:hypothetical protein [Actinopolymorpha alba]|uniref:hypothetical protein n=1 Tax=Actinopolymorpha alba TaxID=533267 RepID=UPI0012F643D4|nr:hypothetical protein [Actinopolymorpha alba]
MTAVKNALRTWLTNIVEPGRVVPPPAPPGRKLDGRTRDEIPQPTKADQRAAP